MSRISISRTEPTPFPRWGRILPSSAAVGGSSSSGIAEPRRPHDGFLHPAHARVGRPVFTSGRRRKDVMKVRTNGVAVAVAVAMLLASAAGAGEVQQRAVPKPVVDAAKGRFKTAKYVGASKEKNEAGEWMYEVSLSEKGMGIDLTV